MSITLEEPSTLAQQQTYAAERLRTSTAAVRLSFTWLGTRKSLTSRQKAQAADTFGAEQQYLSAGEEAARYSASGVPGSHGYQEPHDRPLESRFAAAPGLRHSADPPGSH